MRFDNFNTARCKKCGWTKQFHPGKEYDPSDFNCDCKEEAPEPKLDNTMAQRCEDAMLEEAHNKAKMLGLNVAHNAKLETVLKRIEDYENGN